MSAATPKPYIAPWSDFFRFHLETDSFASTVRLHQAYALRRWAAAPLEAWAKESDAFCRDHQYWSQSVPPTVAQAWIQDFLARTLTQPGAVRALPIVLNLGGDLLVPHPEGNPSHHPMHCALLDAPDRHRLLPLVLSYLPSQPFCDGADPFPGWSRLQALNSLYLAQFSENAHTTAQNMGLIPSPDEQAVLIGSWLKDQQRKRCTIALERWGWTPTPSSALMETWWTAREPDVNHPDRVSAFDRAWGARYHDALGFAPTEREMLEIPLSPAKIFFKEHVLRQFRAWSNAMARSLQWASLLPLSSTDLARMDTVVRRMEADIIQIQKAAPLIGNAENAERAAFERALFSCERCADAYKIWLETGASERRPAPALKRPRL